MDRSARRGPASTVSPPGTCPANPPSGAGDLRDQVADWAASGVLALTGHPDGPPLVPPGRAASRAAELGQVIAEVTNGAVRVDGERLLSERAAFTGRRRAGRMSAGGSCRLLATADGWAAVSCARPDDVALLGALVGKDLPTDPWPAIIAWVRDHTGAELDQRADLLSLAAAAVAPGAPLAVPAAVPPVGPVRRFTGWRVVDFSALWAGPLCAHLLGLAGAEVVKVETPQRPDGARYGHPEFYRLLHSGHRSVVLDPSEPAGRHAMAALVDAADIVIEASRPRALAGFGLDAHAAVDAGTTWISITAAGRSSQRIGFGDDISASAGLVALDADDAPVFCGDAIADPLTGLTAAALALTSPPGVLLDIAMTDVVAATLDRPAGRANEVRLSADGWVVDTSDGPASVAAPRRRRVDGAAPDSGADTAAVLDELGLGPA